MSVEDALRLSSCLIVAPDGATSRIILFSWALTYEAGELEETLDDVVRHNVVHQLGIYFGLSAEEIAALASAENDGNEHHGHVKWSIKS